MWTVVDKSIHDNYISAKNDGGDEMGELHLLCGPFVSRVQIEDYLAKASQMIVIAFVLKYPEDNSHCLL